MTAGIPLTPVTRSVFDGLAWSTLRPSLWRWHVELRWSRLRCRFAGHPLMLYDIGVTCTRCDYYALKPLKDIQ